MRRLGIMILAGTFLGHCFSGNAGTPATASSFVEPHAASEILGKTVENQDGEQLGKVSNLVIDLQTSQARYVIISCGGFLGLGRTLRAVPARVVSLATTKKDIVELDVSRARWAQAPEFKRGDLAARNAAADNQILTYYGVKPEANSAARVGAPTGRSPGPAVEANGFGASLKLASEIKGKKIFTPQQTQLGFITDLLVDLKGRQPSFAILAARTSAREKDEFACHISALMPSHEAFVLATTFKALDAAPVFNEQAWRASPNTGTNAIFRYVESKKNDRGNHEPNRYRGDSADSGGSASPTNKQFEAQTEVDPHQKQKGAYGDE